MHRYNWFFGPLGVYITLSSLRYILNKNIAYSEFTGYCCFDNLNKFNSSYTLAYLNKINRCIPTERKAQETYNYVFCNMERYITS